MGEINRHMELTKENLEEVVVEKITDMIGEAPEKMTDKFNDDLGFDSLDNVELVMEVEKIFDIRIGEELEEKMSVVSVEEFIDLTLEKHA